MNIIWYGQSCFKITASTGKGSEGQVIIITDPFDKSIGLKPPRTRADIVTVSHQHRDHNNVGIIKDNPFIIDGPGEYEIKKVSIKGISSFHDKKQGALRGKNTIYVIEAEDIHLCHLGDLGHILEAGQLEQIGKIDILMIPVGGHYTISWNEADEVINQIEPKIVIPMHYKIPGLTINLDSVDKFCKEMGASSKKTIPKLSIKKKNLPQEEMEIVVMEKS